MTDKKTCSKCGVEKSLDEFNRDSRTKDGRESACRKCRAAYREANREKEKARHAANRETRRASQRTSQRALRAARAARTPEEIAADRTRLRPDGLKACRTCRETLPFSAFGDDRTRADGLDTSCKPCKTRADARRRTKRLAALAAHWQERGFTGGHLLPRVSEDGELMCAYGDGSRTWEHTDHVQALANGGPDDLEGNGVPSCEVHNLSKGATPTHEWLTERMQATDDPDLWLLDSYALDGMEVT